jgi:small conductance mechanosensitive channel
MKQASLFFSVFFALLLTALPLAAQNAAPATQAPAQPAAPAAEAPPPATINIPTPQGVAKDVQDAFAKDQEDKEKLEGLRERQVRVQGLINTLQNQKSRDAFITNLKGMLEVQNIREQKQSEKMAPPGEKALDAVTKTVSDLGKNFTLIGKGFADLPETSRLITEQFETEEARNHTLKLIAEALIAWAAGCLAFVLIRFILRRPRDLLANMPTLSFPTRLLVFGGYHFLALMPIVGFTVASLFTLQSFGMPQPVAHATALLLYAFIVLQLCMWILRMVFATRAPSRRLIPVDDESAAYLYVWLVRLSAMIVFGAFIAQAALTLEIPVNTIHAFTSLMGFFVTLMVVIIVLQNRTNVADWLRGKHKEKEEDKKESVKEKRKTVFLQSLRDHLSGVWHILAIIYLIVGYLVATLDIENGFATLTRATVITVVVLLGFHFFLRGIDELVEKGFALPAELRRQFPRLEERTNSYLPILQRVLKLLVWAVGLVVLLGAWGVDTFDWFSQPPTQKFFTGAIAIAVTLLLTVLAWELVGSFIERYLRGEERNGRRIERSARVRTLLPLLRYTLQIILIIVAGVVILGEIGVNTTPFLAGAGIIGLAIGFGSQALVKDFITGLFILMEDTMSVGDIVKIEDHSGVVESITIRTVRLRDANGYVHTVGFGNITNIINMTKHYARVVFQIPVAYESDWRLAMKIMQEVTEEMRKEDAFKAAIYEPMEMQGIDSYADSWAIILARIRTQPLQQWNVKREFLLRLKDRFDEAGIGFPYPVGLDRPPPLYDLGVEPKGRMGPVTKQIDPNAVRTPPKNTPKEETKDQAKAVENLDKANPPPPPSTSE